MGSVGASINNITVATTYDERVERYWLKAFRVEGASEAELRDGMISIFRWILAIRSSPRSASARTW